jgi:beta-lactamase superfamily II metal-dependent hydrolase
MLFRLAVAAVLLVSMAPPNTRTLDIYFLDVEGGQSTLVVTPARQSLLIDTGYPDRNGRDPDRIMAAVRDAQISRIDYLLITHFHEDHDGGAAELARRIPIGTFVDSGSPIETSADVVAAFAAYEQARRTGGHLVPKPGDRLPFRGVDVDVVTADGATLARALPGAGQSNPACAAYAPRIADDTAENPRSIGVRLRYGAFRFLDLGDLVWNKEGQLVCPNNLIGEVEVYLATHHGNGDASVPAVLAALRPQVAISNNGIVKGGTATALSMLRSMVGEERVWQLHWSANNGVVNAPDAFVANLNADEKDIGAWLKLTATEDGRFSVTNGRTGWTKTYDRR